MENLKEGFKLIPGFTKYAVNAKGEVINAKVGTPVMRKSDNPLQVQIPDDKRGVRLRVNVPETVAALFPKKTKKEKKSPAKTQTNHNKSKTPPRIKQTDIPRRIREKPKKEKVHLQVVNPGYADPVVKNIIESDEHIGIKALAMVLYGLTYAVTGGHLNINANQVSGLIYKAKANTGKSAAAQILLNKSKK